MVNQRIGFIGAGRVASVLAQLWSEAGERILGVTSRNEQSAQRLARGIEDCLVFESAQQLADYADIVFITVPDDAIAEVAAQVAWQPEQRVVHCSAATELTALAPAAAQGAYVGGFHPLQIFSDPATARRHLPGSFIAIEAQAPLLAELERLAGVLHCRPLDLPPGARVRYHVAANYAASFLLAVLKEAEDLWQQCGLPGDLALQALMPLAAGTLAAADAAGLSGALAGPFARGDIGVVQRHLAALQQSPATVAGESGTDFYRLLGSRLLALAQARGLPQKKLHELQRLLQHP